MKYHIGDLLTVDYTCRYYFIVTTSQTKYSMYSFYKHEILEYNDFVVDNLCKLLTDIFRDDEI